MSNTKHVHLTQGIATVTQEINFQQLHCLSLYFNQDYFLSYTRKSSSSEEECLQVGLYFADIKQQDLECSP